LKTIFSDDVENFEAKAEKVHALLRSCNTLAIHISADGCKIVSRC